MTTPTAIPFSVIPTREATLEEAYLEEVEELRSEIAAAMRAISGNSLQVLEESLWRQEVLCTSLTRLLQAMQAGGETPASMNRVHAATHALHALNHTYTALVQQSRASADLFYGLCQSYRHGPAREVLQHPVPRYSFEA